jgi:GrpB-like predicted nucleotidyltransferase (UPF0157 family)
MIGLKRNRVQVVEHDPGWAGHGVDACRQVQQAGGNLIVDVEHVGSTAVPGLPAKPILDLVAGVAGLRAVPELVERLTAVGFVYRGDEKETGGHLFIWDSAPRVRAIHLHVVLHGHVQWNNYLRFRNVLRQDPVMRERYADLKRELARRFPDDRESYTAAKDAFIREVLTADPHATD